MFDCSKSVLCMEEMKPFAEKPADRTIALAIYNGVFIWQVATKIRAKRPRNM